MKNEKVVIKYVGGNAMDLIHEAGASRGGIWLTINESIVNNLRPYIDVSKPSVKELLSSAALACLLGLEKDGYLKETK